MIEILLTLLWTVLLAVGLRYLPFFKNIRGLPYKLLVILFLIKVLTGQAYALIYTHYYDPQTADIHRFFRDGKVLFSALKDNPLDYLRMLTGIGAGAEHLQPYYTTMNDWFRPWLSPVYNDNRIMIRFNAFMQLFSMGILQVHVVMANFISLAGFVALYKFAIRYLDPLKDKWLIPGLFLMPSVLFWSSGVIKETLLFPAMGFFLLATDRIIDKENRQPALWLIMFAMLGLLLLLKAYTLFLLLPCYLAFRLALKQPPRLRWMAFPAVILVYVLLILVAGQVFPQYNLIGMMAAKQTEFMLFSLSVNVGSLIHEVYLQPTFTSIVSYLPRGLANTLFYPHLLDADSPVTMMAAAENILIFIVLAATLWHTFRNKNIHPLVWMGLWLTLITFTFVGTITQVSGGLVRYKIPALPFLWMAFVSVMPAGLVEQKLTKWFPSMAGRFRIFHHKIFGT
ncbi:MAG: hypothetical protein R6U64_08895 [Bacteroidales bacterium]